MVVINHLSSSAASLGLPINAIHKYHSPILCLKVLISVIQLGIIRVAHLQLGSPRVMNVKHVILHHLFAHSAGAFGEVEAPLVESGPDRRTP